MNKEDMLEYLKNHPAESEIEPAELNLTEDMQAKVKLLEVLNKAMKHHEQNFYHHASRLRAALDSLKTIEMSKKELFGEGK